MKKYLIIIIILIILVGGCIKTNSDNKKDNFNRTSDPTIFIDNENQLSIVWSKYDDKTDIERCEGVVFSILALIDGSNPGFPAINLSLAPHPENKEFDINLKRNWYESGMVFNDDCALHEFFSNNKN